MWPTKIYHEPISYQVKNNGKWYEAYLFNTEHQKFVDNISSSDLVSSLDRQLSQCIEESLRAMSCTKPSSKKNKSAKNAADSETFVGNDSEQAPGVPAGPAHSHSKSVRYPASPIGSIESSVCNSCQKVTEDNVFCTRC